MEPSFFEYAEALAEANNRISTNGFQCLHNNCGWSGYYITTPKGNKYQLVKNSIFDDDRYFLCEYSSRPFSTGISLGLEFKDLEECKQYLLSIENKENTMSSEFEKALEEALNSPTLTEVE